MSGSALASTPATIFGTKVTITCAGGQQFATGVSQITTECLPGGAWSTSYIPQCQDVYCGPVPQIDNGFAIDATNVTHRGEATYQCYAGFGFSSGLAVERIRCTEKFAFHFQFNFESRFPISISFPVASGKSFRSAPPRSALRSRK